MYNLTLFVGSMGPKNKQYLKELESVLKKEVGEYKLDIIDVVEYPEKAEEFKIMATPTLIRNIPTPVFRLVGRMNNIQGIFAVED